MVEFVRDVMIAVAVLATLIAVAVHASPEAERHGSPSVTTTSVASAAVPSLALTAAA